MIELRTVFLDDPRRSELESELQSQGFEARSSINQAPVTGEYFPPYDVWVKYPVVET